MDLQPAKIWCCTNVWHANYSLFGKFAAAKLLYICSLCAWSKVPTFESTPPLGVYSLAVLGVQELLSGLFHTYAWLYLWLSLCSIPQRLLLHKRSVQCNFYGRRPIFFHRCAWTLDKLRQKLLHSLPRKPELPWLQLCTEHHHLLPAWPWNLHWWHTERCLQRSTRMWV